jgi:hypothetical protein
MQSVVLCTFSGLSNGECRRAAFCRRGEKVEAVDYFLAVRTDGEINATFSHIPHDLVQSVCALHQYGFCRVGCCVRCSAKNQGKEVLVTL